MKRLFQLSLSVVILSLSHFTLAAKEESVSPEKVVAAIKPGDRHELVERYLKDHHFHVTYLPAEARIAAVLPNVSRTFSVSTSLVVVVYLTTTDLVEKVEVRVERTGT